MTNCENLAALDELFGSLFTVDPTFSRLSVTVGPFCILMHIPEDWKTDLTERHAGFQVCSGYDFIIESRPADDLDLSHYTTLDVQQNPENGTQYAFRWDFLARIDPIGCVARVLLTPYANFLSIDTVLRVVASALSLSRGGLLVHASAVATPAGGFLFPGISGSGKSTIAELSRGRYTVLTDEIAMLEKTPAGYGVWGTPFWGARPAAIHTSAPLKAVLLPVKSTASRVVAVSPAFALTEFLRSVLAFGQGSRAGNALLDAAMQLIDTASFQQIHFTPDKTFWEAINDSFGK